ncbi:MBL fold metallo-hydrolase [Microbacterium gorillae]|uniref:hypothetical protein n=1 Tax=Microbacterium gorillae TaxID=1231063 RepID=UPI00058EFDEB|nr:hypothetical protein [Microbacterium gorillae]
MSIGDDYAVCTSCGLQFPSVEPPEFCPLSHDNRSSFRGLPEGWTTLAELRKTEHHNVIRQDGEFMGLCTSPSLNFGQRGFIVPWGDSNLMWDMVPYFDDDTYERIQELGGLKGIAISHPHFFSTMIEWADRFDVPIYIHEDNRPWVFRPSERIHFWSGESFKLDDDMTLVRTGGHFAGSQILHIASKKTVLVADSVNLVSDPGFVSFEYGWAQIIPTDEEAVRQVVAAYEPYEFETIVGGWWDQRITGNYETIRRSGDRFIAALRGDLAARNVGMSPASSAAYAV